MTDRKLRPLQSEDERRAAYTLFRNSLHVAAPTEEEWERADAAYQPELTFGAFADDELVGTACSFEVDMTVPGGVTLPTAAVSAVGVRSDRTRRGVLTDLMRHQLDDLVVRGRPLAALYASESAIYGRFGYGVAAPERTCRINRRRAEVRASAPTGGEIELHDLESARRALPELYRELPPGRPGVITRTRHLWPLWEGHFRRSSGLARLVVHRGAGTPDGYAMYRVSRDQLADGDRSVMHIEDMATVSDEAFADLWRYLVGVDLVDRIIAHGRPLDEPLEVLFTDYRACTVTDVEDGVWLRLVDVPAALSARTYHGDASIIVEVRDEFLPANSGRFAVSSDRVERVERPAQLRMDVDTLAMLYLGGWRVPQLVSCGRVEVVDERAVAMADQLLATDLAPWCGTFF